MAYSCAILLTGGSSEAEEHNARWLGPMTLGIEVTQDILAARCGLGNINPQHVPGGGGISSAIEAALQWPLPPSGAKLVTIREDKDSLCAMAIIALRVDGHEDKIDKQLVNWIGALDRMTYFDARDQYPELAAMFDKVPTDAMNYIIKTKDKRWENLVTKVRGVGQILCGVMSHEQMKKLSDLRAIDRAESPRDFNDQLEMYGTKVAFIEATGQYENARNWGNRLYDTTVVYDKERVTKSGGLQQRWSVVRKRSTFDRKGFEAAINAAEALARGIPAGQVQESSLMWGGNDNIVSSPQGSGYGTKLSKEQILAIVRTHAESGIVS